MIVKLKDAENNGKDNAKTVLLSYLTPCFLHTFVRLRSDLYIDRYLYIHRYIKQSQKNK